MNIRGFVSFTRIGALLFLYLMASLVRNRRAVILVARTGPRDLGLMIRLLLTLAIADAIIKLARPWSVESAGPH